MMMNIKKLINSTLYKNSGQRCLHKAWNDINLITNHLLPSWTQNIHALSNCMSVISDLTLRPAIFSPVHVQLTTINSIVIRSKIHNVLDRSLE